MGSVQLRIQDTRSQNSSHLSAQPTPPLSSSKKRSPDNTITTSSSNSPHHNTNNNLNTSSLLSIFQLVPQSNSKAVTMSKPWVPPTKEELAALEIKYAGRFERDRARYNERMGAMEQERQLELEAEREREKRERDNREIMAEIAARSKGKQKWDNGKGKMPATTTKYTNLYNYASASSNYATSHTPGTLPPNVHRVSESIRQRIEEAAATEAERRKQAFDRLIAGRKRSWIGN